MRHEQAPIRVSHETIYRHIYSEEGRRGELWRHLPSGRRRRRVYRLRKRPPPEFASELSILFRPDVIAHCKEFGHWEADLALLRQKFGPANVITMIERTSRFLVVLKNAESNLWRLSTSKRMDFPCPALGVSPDSRFRSVVSGYSCGTRLDRDTGDAP